MTGTITNVGSVDNEFTYTLNENTKADNYNIETEPGKLTITAATDKVVVTIKGHTGTAKYDGQSHSVTGYDVVSISDSKYTENDFSFSGKAEATGVDAKTSYMMGLNATQFENTNDNFAEVEFIVTDGALTIEKRSVKLTSASDSKPYDGTPLTNSNVTVSGDGFVEGEGASYDVTGTITNVGSVDNEFTYTLNENTKADNYEITKYEGKLTITDREEKYEITVEANSASATYDGEEHSAIGFKTLEFTVDGNTYTVEGLKTEDPRQTNAGEYTNNISGEAIVKDAEGNDVTAQFTVNTEDGKLEIAKRKVKVTVKKLEYAYDYANPAAHPADDVARYTVEAANGDRGLLAGDTLNVDVLYDGQDTQTLIGVYAAVAQTDDATITNSKGDDVADNYAIEPEDSTLTIKGDKIFPEKTTPNVESNYKLGDTILFTITVKNVSTEPVENITVEDQMAIIVAGAGYTVSADGYTATIDSLASGAQVEIKAEHVVTEKDILAGTVGNTATVTWPDGTRNVSAKSDDIEKPNSALKVVKETTSEPKNGKTYALDEEIKYTITVTNTGNLTATDIEVTDSLSTNEGKVIGTIASLAPDESKTFNFTYTVTEQDILNGKVLNEATAKGKTPDDKTPEGKDEQKDDTDDVDTTLEVVKTSNKQPGETAKLGEKIEYTITVTNKGNVSYTNVKVDDELTGLHETIAKLGVGENKKFTTEWTVTEDDILNGKVLNVATAKGDEVPDPKDPENPKTPEGEGEKKDDTEGKNSELKVVKETTSEPKNGKTYALDEEIKYTITVTNTGNLTATDIEVTDSLSTNEGKVIGTIASLAPDESKTFNFTYTVTEQDILNGKVLNEATAKGKTPDDKTPEGKDEQKDDTDDVDTTLEVVKTSNKQPGETAKLGEKIEYTITVTNKGNVSYTNVKVDDELTGLHETIAKLGVGENKKFTTEWTVTEDDILNGKVLNVATAKGDKVPDPKDPENPKTPEGEGKKEDDTEEKQSSFTVEKTLTNLPEKGYFTLGETAEFNITVENTGNLTLTDLTVTEQLSGAKYAESNAYTVNGADAIIAELKPGEQVVIKASYTITEDDLGNKDLKNVVTGKGKGPDGKDPEGGDEEEVPTDDAISVSGSKTWDDQDNRFEVRPETITLRLHADGAEYKTAEIGADQNWTYKFSKLPKHTKSGAEIVYTVTEDAVVGYETTTVETDSGVNFTNTLRQCTLHIDYTYIRHKGGTPHEAFPPVDMVLYYGQDYSVKSPKLWGFVPNIHKVEGVITEDTMVHVLYSGLDYTLTIEYVYEDGTTAAPTHTEVLKIYDRYGVASPKIPGYVPTWEFVAGSMYAHDEYYRIVYRAIKPQGVGNITLNLGDCFE